MRAPAHAPQAQPQRLPARPRWPAQASLSLLLALAACGGGGGADSDGSGQASSPAPSTPGGATDGGTQPITGGTILTGGVSPVGSGSGDGTGGGGAGQGGAAAGAGGAGGSGLALQVATDSGFGAADLAVLIAQGDATSEAIGQAYQRARGIPDAQVIRLPVATLADTISAADFAQLKQRLDGLLPERVQATLVTWSRPSRVLGSCAMSLTSALAFGYDPRYCGSCNRTQASAYYDSSSGRPWADLRIRPSMMLGAATLADAQQLIARGLAADGRMAALAAAAASAAGTTGTAGTTGPGSAGSTGNIGSTGSSPGTVAGARPGTGQGWLLRTHDPARSVRYPDFGALSATVVPGLAWHYQDGSADASLSSIGAASDVMFYFTGLSRVPHLDSVRWLPGAVADHLTSFGGLLPDANGQMPATDWLAAGATGSFGTVEEPCNYTEKFPRASVLASHYLRGASLIEAYWKSVEWPGQGLFVGEPLARPWGRL